jgi:hypothetical protein
MDFGIARSDREADMVIVLGSRKTNDARKEDPEIARPGLCSLLTNEFNGNASFFLWAFMDGTNNRLCASIETIFLDF